MVCLFLFSLWFCICRLRCNESVAQHRSGFTPGSCMYLLIGPRILGRQKHPLVDLKWLLAFYWYCTLKTSTPYLFKEPLPTVESTSRQRKNRNIIPLLHQTSTRICTFLSSSFIKKLKYEDFESCTWLDPPKTRLLICFTRLDLMVST